MTSTGCDVTALRALIAEDACVLGGCGIVLGIHIKALRNNSQTARARAQAGVTRRNEYCYSHVHNGRVVCGR